MSFLAALWKNSQPQQSWIGLVEHPLVQKLVARLGLNPKGYWVKWFVWNFWRNPFGFLLETLAIHALKTGQSNFNPNGGWLLRPFYFSYRGPFLFWSIETYLGVRPSTGILGAALRKAHASNEKGQPG